ncbi:hypothetical protein AVEN_30170-1 [Araneus ventricosus]|uniref:Uncharacterized protein n=1 Tax=Araneus ventricosus TaxID=182803 RepID=A0A4Y2KTM4_ARAVE|nr:hypothetical protein AVEN_30170-1 [Araneus ventricosus]
MATNLADFWRARRNIWLAISVEKFHEVIASELTHMKVVNHVRGINQTENIPVLQYGIRNKYRRPVERKPSRKRNQSERVEPPPKDHNPTSVCIPVTTTTQLQTCPMKPGGKKFHYNTI